MVIENSQRWAPGIGDPTFMGWFTVAAYFVAVALCVRCAMQERESNGHRRFWWLLAAILAVLGLNKQLDLQTWLTQAGKDMALSQGWYENRRVVQAAFIAILLAIGLSAQVLIYRAACHLGRQVRWAIGGLVFLTVFIVMRATSFHHVDLLLHTEIGGWRLNWIFELSGIGGIIVAVAWRLKVLRFSSSTAAGRKK